MIVPGKGSSCVPSAISRRLVVSLAATAQSVLAILAEVSIVCISTTLVARNLGTILVIDRWDWELPLGQIGDVLLLAL